MLATNIALGPWSVMCIDMSLWLRSCGSEGTGILDHFPPTKCLSSRYRRGFIRLPPSKICLSSVRHQWTLPQKWRRRYQYKHARELHMGDWACSTAICRGCSANPQEGAIASGSVEDDQLPPAFCECSANACSNLRRWHVEYLQNRCSCLIADAVANGLQHLDVRPPWPRALR